MFRSSQRGQRKQTPKSTRSHRGGRPASMKTVEGLRSAVWEQIWEQNSAKPPSITATWRNSREDRQALTSAFTTARTPENLWPVAHHPEVAGSKPVPATKRSGPRRFIRGPLSWSLLFVAYVTIRDARECKRHAAYRGSTASMALMTSGASGSVRGRNRLTTSPSGATRNFSKFH